MALTPAQDIDADFDHLLALILHSWSEREVAAAAMRLKEKVHEQLKPADLIYSSKERHALPARPAADAVRPAVTR